MQKFYRENVTAVPVNALSSISSGFTLNLIGFKAPTLKRLLFNAFVTDTTTGGYISVGRFLNWTFSLPSGVQALAATGGAFVPVFSDKGIINVNTQFTFSPVLGSSFFTNYQIGGRDIQNQNIPLATGGSLTVRALWEFEDELSENINDQGIQPNEFG